MSVLNITCITIGNQRVTLSKGSRQRVEAAVLTLGRSLPLNYPSDELVYSPETGQMKYLVKSVDRQLQIVGQAFTSTYNDLLKQSSVIYQPNEMNNLTLEAAEIYQKMVHPKLAPGMAGGAIVAAAAGVDALSFVRNTCGVRIGWDQAIRHMGIGGGTLSLGLNALDLHNARKERQSALEIQYNEGKDKATAKIAGSSIGLIASIFYVLGKANELSWIAFSVGTVTALTAVCTAFWGIGAIISIALAGFGIYRCRVLDHRLSAFGTNEAGAKQALSYLLAEVTVLQAEREALRKELESKGEYSGSAFHEKLEELGARKIKYLKTRTSMRAVQMLLDRAPSILENFDLAAAQQLLTDVRYEGYKKKLVYTIGMIASIIGLIGVVLGCFASMGALPLILFAGSAAIGLGLTMANSLARLDYSKRVERPRFSIA
jgi:hypothetical protein